MTIKKNGESNSVTDDLFVLTESNEIFGQPLDILVQTNDNHLPNFIFQLIMTMEKYGGLNVIGIYRESGQGNSMKSIIEDISRKSDIKIPTSEQQLHDLANVLKYFIKSIPESAICDPHSKNIIDVMKSGYNNEAAAQCLAQLPLPHRSFLFVLFYHLLEISNKSDINKMDSFNIGVCFGPTLLPYQLDCDYIDLLHQNELVNMLIKNFSTVFIENKPFMDGILSMIPEQYQSQYECLKL